MGVVSRNRAMERKPLTDERWRQIETIFHQAAVIEKSARAAGLTHLCESDPELRQVVEAMLDASDRESSSLPISKQVHAMDLAGRRVGNYRLDRLLGEGGMGSVYLASRADGQFEQHAAVKLLAGYLRGEFFTDRFRVERQALASLNHPNVTRLLDSGVTPEGDPYLVMEYVDGQPIDAYCDQERLAIPGRIRLFLQVCEAVEYAHRHQIVHRDLKPANVFVNREGAVKLLDFGTAKLLAAADADITRTRFQMMTPRYASPEQLRGEAVHPPTDVYSLGVMLYESLTGTWPFGDPSSAIAGLERAIRDVDPMPPGSAITHKSADARSTPVAKLARTIEGDLANIMLKAIQPDTRRRYGSVGELASELRNYLEGKPVSARPRTLVYRAQKLVRRNRVAAAAALVLAIGIFTVGTFVFLKRSAVTTAPSIAVLPFVDRSADANSDSANLYLRSGMTEEITEALSRLKGLRVIGRASAAQFAAKPVDLHKSGRSLNVTHVLESSVERSGDQLTMIASLERTSDGVRLWTNTYRRPVTGVGAIETDLEARILDSLGLAGPARKAHVVPDQAHDYYLKARFEENQATPQTNTEAQQDFRRAIEIDPEYAAAYADLGGTIWNRNAKSVGRPDWNELRTVEQLLQRAIALDPGLLRAHVSLGIFAEQCDWDWNRAEREFQASLAAGPNAGGELGLALLYVILGRRSEADEHLRRGRDLDPFSTSAAINTTIVLGLEGRLAEEREIIQQLATQNPAALNWQVQLNSLDAHLGYADKAVANLRRLAERQPRANLALASAEAAAGHREEALRILRPMEENYENGDIPMFQFALIYADLDDEPNTVKWLERSLDAREGGATHIRVEPVFAKMQHTPEFRELKQRMGLPQ
jgi:eukaryotic-like serine/threonine-protein kinase